MRTRLYKLYWKMRDMIAPRLTHSQHLYEEVLKGHVRNDTMWLDLGCGHQVLPFWREQQEKDLVGNCGTIVGMDFDLPSLQKHRSISLRVRGDINTLPFKDSSFDLVTANMVVEHLATPAIQFREISRILKPGGIFLFHTPNATGYPTLLNKLAPEMLKHRLIYLLDGREENDVFETHYSANTENQIANLAQASGFQVERIRMTVSDAIFALVLPLAVAELVFIRVLMTDRLKNWRTDIISVLKKDTGEALAEKLIGHHARHSPSRQPAARG
jgi:ubiquinone/menaquinone biosynthesis C-methylase UbiE